MNYLNLVKYTFYFACTLVLATLIFVFVVLIGFPLGDLEQYADKGEEKEKVSKIDREFALEEGSLVNIVDLRYYHLFSDMDTSWEEWIKKSFEEAGFQYIDTKKELILVNKKQVLGNLISNECKKPSCFAHQVDFDNIPSVFWKGRTGIEDYRFLSHFGIDFKSIVRAILTDIRKLKFVQGGSTLTQQLVKNLFLSNEKSLYRKVKEIILAIYLETRFSKEEILEIYFNEIYWGTLQGMRVKGLHSASLFYFDRRPNQLTSYQVAVLVALLKGPNFYHPIRHVDRLIKRTNIIFTKLTELNLFSSKGGQIWSKSIWDKWRKGLIKKNRSAPYRSIWMAGSVSKNKVFNGYENFVFIRSVNKTLQRIKQRVGDKDISVKSYIGRISDLDSEDHFLFYSKFERDRINAINIEKHQVGSILKPILYGIFTKFGKSLSDTISTSQISLNLKSGTWSPKEAHKVTEDSITLLHALLKSYNRPVIRLASDIGFEIIERDLRDYIRDLKLPLSQYPAQLLGAIELSIKQVYEIFFKFVKEECKKIKKGVSEVEAENARRNNILYLLSKPEDTTVSRVVGTHMANMRFFGKTGTSNHGFDNWYVFYDGHLLGAIWVGLEGKERRRALDFMGVQPHLRFFSGFFVKEVRDLMS